MPMPALALGAANLAIGVGTGAAGIMGARSDYKEQARIKAENDRSAKDSYILKTHLMGRRIRETRQAVSQKQEDNQLKALSAKASAITSAAAAGTSGRSVESLLDDFERSSFVVDDRLEQSREAEESQIYQQGLAAQAEAQSRINGVPMPSTGALYAGYAQGVGSIAGGVSDFADIYDGDMRV